MPKGTRHAASTQESLSGHVTVGVHVATWRDVVADAWRRVEADPSLDDALPGGWIRDRDAFAREVEARLGALHTAWAGIAARELADGRIDRFLSTRSPAMRGALVDRESLASVDDTTTVRRRRGSVCDVRVRGESLIVLLGDRRLEMPPWLEPAMRTIAGSEAFRVRDLAGAIPDAESRVVLTRRLVREGLLQLTTGR
jgi:hypothetical protein